MTDKWMLRSTIAVLALGTVACASVRGAEQRSPDEMARRRLAQLLRAPETTPQVREAGERQPELPFEIHTWQVRTTADGTREIVVLGRGLERARTLRIGEVVVPLTPAGDGRSASGRLPDAVPDDASAVITVAEHQVELPERFSRLKVEGKLPRIHACRYQWEDVQSKAGKVRALRFDCDVSGFRARNAPVTAFIGSLVVPNTQITEREDGLTGYVYEPGKLKENDPLMVDFGHGLRVLAPALFRKP